MRAIHGSFFHRMVGQRGAGNDKPARLDRHGAGNHEPAWPDRHEATRDGQATAAIPYPSSSSSLRISFCTACSRLEPTTRFATALSAGRAFSMAQPQPAKRMIS